MFDGIAARLLLQGPMAGALSDFVFDPSSDLIVCTTSFGQALSDIAAQAPGDPTASLQYWWAAVTVLDSYVADWQAIDATTGASVVPATQAAVDAMLASVAPALTASELAALRSIGFGDGSQTGTGGSGALEIGAQQRRRPLRSAAGSMPRIRSTSAIVRSASRATVMLTRSASQYRLSGGATHH